MIPDYSIQDQKNQGRTRKPEKGVAKAHSSYLEVLLEDAPPESMSTPTPILASSNHEKDLNYPRYLRNLNNAPNNKKIAKRTYHHCHFRLLHYASST
jgi:hypothetical protein